MIPRVSGEVHGVGVGTTIRVRLGAVGTVGAGRTSGRAAVGAETTTTTTTTIPWTRVKMLRTDGGEPAMQLQLTKQLPSVKAQTKDRPRANTGSRKGKAQDTESSGKAGPEGGSPAKGAEATAKAKAKATAKSTAKGKAKGTPRHGKGKGTVSAEPSPAILDPASTANSWEWGLDSPEGLSAVVSSS